MAEQQNKVVPELNNNEPIADNNTSVPSPTDGNTVNQKNVNTNNNEPINDNNNNEPITDNNTGASSPIAGPSGTAINTNNNELINGNNEPVNDTNNSDSSPTAGPSGTRVIPRKNWIKCDICNVFVSSQKLMQVHLSGKRHNIIARKINECPRNYSCELCKIKANSEKQLADHYVSKKHRGRVEELERIEDIKFYCMYGTIIIILSWIIISYMLYFTFIFTE